MGYKVILDICRDLEEKLGLEITTSQKLLLLERGTVEGLLTVLQGRPIKVRVLRQEPVDGHQIRNTVLADSLSGETLVEAESMVYLDKMEERVKDDILGGHLGIGETLAKHLIETRREFREIGFNEKSQQFYRIYDIYVHGLVWFRVRESFSISLYRAKEGT